MEYRRSVYGTWFSQKVIWEAKIKQIEQAIT